MRWLFASCLTFVAIFWSFIHSTKWQIYNYERKQTNFNSKFPLDIVVRSFQNASFLAKIHYQKLHLFVVEF